MKNTISIFAKRFKALLTGIIAGLVLFGSFLYIINSNGSSTEKEDTTKSIVTLATPATYAGKSEISLIGTVRALSEAQISADRGGRVTSVNAKLNSKVGAGAIIVTLENSSERASVLQAEGAYEAALASASQTSLTSNDADIALTNSQRSAVTSIKDAYNVTNGIVLNSIDQFFSEPNSPLIGLRIDGRGYTSQLNAERMAYQTLLPEWKSRTDSVTVNSDIQTEIDYSINNVRRTISFIDTFLTVFNQQKTGSRYSEAELMEFNSNFTNLRSTLLSLVTKLYNNLASLESAETNKERAKQSAEGGKASVADASVKQALGVLRSAQANLAKTILRTPISGTINSISVKNGDFVSAFTPLAIVANNSALEVVTYAGDLELKSLAVGTEVIIDGKYKGVVAQIAPAIDQTTAKTEVRVVTEEAEIKNGDTVKITLATAPAPTKLTEVKVPITAIKFEVDDGSIYLVEDGKLVQREVTLGNVTGSSVVIESGLGIDEEFVIDVRGLQPGMVVDIK